jgi:hypothetical protein
LTNGFNHAKIPDQWEGWRDQGRLVFGPDPQIVFYDPNTLGPTKQPSIRIDGPPTKGNGWREVNAYDWVNGQYSSIPVSPGDHIVFAGYVKTGHSTSGLDGQDQAGGLFGFDLYSPSSRIWEVAVGYPASTDFNSMNWAGYNWTPYNTDWVKKIIDMTVPTMTFTVDDGGKALDKPSQASNIIPWLSMENQKDAGKGWFSDFQLYVNPITAGPVQPTCPTGQHVDPATNLCVPDVVPPTPKPSASVAARVPGIGNRAFTQIYLRTLRDRLIRKEVHEKLHPLV